ncbi:MAG: M6 family metalloprotease domain-containing protein [Bacteroidales bacterium]|nr:M6 family metalloprotease domain-containing protein [Bacteroidales bacterium]
MKKLLSTILLIAFAIGSVLAAPLKNVPCTITQPNGQVIHCFVSGDEFFNYYHDAAGYTIIQNPQTGYYTYGIERDGKVVPTEYIVGQTDPAATAALTPGARISEEIIMARRMERARQIREHSPNVRNRELNHGQMNNIVVFISFQDDTIFPKTYSQVDAMFNDTSTANANSLKNFYKHVSYEQFTIQSHLLPQAGPNNMIISYHDSHPENYYRPCTATNPIGYTSEGEEEDTRASREWTLVDNAVAYVRNFIPEELNLDYNNDGYVDNMVFVVNCGVGGWSDLLWPHRWGLYDRTVYIHGKIVGDYNLILADDDHYFDIGTMCHEMFHTLSAPDLYSSSGNDTYNGNWDLMEGTTNPPQNMHAYMKWKYGNWIDIPEASENGVYTLYPVATSPHCAYKIVPDRMRPNQYVVIEYRNTSTLFDGTVYGTGAVIYRVNTEINGNHNTNYAEASYPEVYTFRKGGFPGADAYTGPSGDYNLYQSYFGSDDMTEFSEYTDPYPFFCNNTRMTGFRISNITDMGDSLQFSLVKGEMVVDTFPWVEMFESSMIHYSFYHEYVTNNVNWKIKEGNQTGSIPSAHTGNGNALFYTTASSATKLVLPTFDFSFLLNPVLSFWYGQTSGSNYSLKLYYRQSSSEGWTLLQSFSTFTGQWTQANVNLPNPSSTYQIAFEAVGANGEGLVLDDIMINGTPITEFNITASAGEHGQISPSGTVAVPVHGTQTFDLIPEEGYTVDELLVDGTSQIRTLHYTFENVVAAHTISATFRLANPSMYATPNALYYNTIASGEVSDYQLVTVIANDMVEDIQVAVEAPFKVSNDQENYGLTTTMPYNGGMVYVVFAPETGGTYHKTMTITCQGIEKTVSLNASATRIEEWNASEMQLYPNPAGNSLNLVFSSANLPEKAEILDICGRTVMAVDVVDGTVVVNVANLNAGVYFVRADNKVKKFIKK